MIVLLYLLNFVHLGLGNVSPDPYMLGLLEVFEKLKWFDLSPCPFPPGVPLIHLHSSWDQALHLQLLVQDLEIDLLCIIFDLLILALGHLPFARLYFPVFTQPYRFNCFFWNLFVNVFPLSVVGVCPFRKSLGCARVACWALIPCASSFILLNAFIAAWALSLPCSVIVSYW